MARTNFPYRAFVLTPTFKIKQVTVVEEAWYRDYYQTDSGKSYYINYLYRSKPAALAAGRKTIEEQRARLAKSQAAIDKRAANLDAEEKG